MYKNRSNIPYQNKSFFSWGRHRHAGLSVDRCASPVVWIGRILQHDFWHHGFLGVFPSLLFLWFRFWYACDAEKKTLEFQSPIR